ncbi:hypothetical protein KI387_015453, partial [Taxus chinensis]
RIHVGLVILCILGTAIASIHTGLLVLFLCLAVVGTYSLCARAPPPPLLGIHGRIIFSRSRTRSNSMLEKKAKHPLVEYETRYFSQILDHFTYRPQGYKVFQQRYLINDKHWGGAKKKAPIFVYTGNEGTIESFANNTGFFFENAPKFGALLVIIE